ncbi:cytochrome P450 [Streptomyces montanisoli]|nr:cytochrome P450 [Streptomyces montanisoli]
MCAMVSDRTRRFVELRGTLPALADSVGLDSRDRAALMRYERDALETLMRGLRLGPARRALHPHVREEVLRRCVPGGVIVSGVVTTRKAPVAPGALPGLGHVPQLLRDPLRLFGSAHRDGAPVTRIMLGNRAAHLVTTPQLVRTVLSNVDGSFDKGGPVMNAIRGLLGNGLLTCTADDHARQRPMMQVAFARTHLDAYVPMMAQCAREMAESWTPGGTVALDAEMLRTAILVACRTLISAEPYGTSVTAMADAIPELVRGLFRRTVVPLPPVHRLPLPSNRRYQRAERTLAAAMEEIVKHYRSLEEPPDDLLSHIMAVSDPATGLGMTDGEIEDQVRTVLTAGTETTASLLAWTFHLLGGHPDVEDRLWKELDAVLGGRVPALSDLKDLPYTKRVLTEALRLYPPGWLLSRTTTRRVRLGGHELERGAEILFSPYFLHRDEDTFPEPDRFLPDRWLPQAVTSRQREAFVAMGGGRRKCIGDVFGMTEATIVLAVVASRWRLRPANATAVRPALRIVLNPSALPMTAEPR